MGFPINDLYLRTLRGERVERTPIWVMRQAGRYLPEYRAVRESAGSFLALCQNADLAAEVTLQPIERFGLDAAIVFSDILTIPDAMGLGLELEEGIGPVFKRPIRSKADIEKLGVPDPQAELGYVMRAIQASKAALENRIPLIGFSGSPWTLAAYMVEGRGSKDFRRAKGLIFDQPDDAHKLLKVLSRSVSVYLQAQIEAGANALMVFDSWGGMLSSSDYRDFSLAYMHEIVSEVKASHPTIPITLFTKGGGLWLEQIRDTGCDAIGLDWTIDLSSAKERVGADVVLQGNMDPVIMNMSKERVVARAQEVLHSYGDHDESSKGHVFNLGHGIQPFADPENMRRLVTTVKTQSAKYHAQFWSN